MTAYVFLGPTLPVDAARSVLEAVYLPPVRHGDVWRVAAYGNPSAIGIVDGFFEHVPSVWHKEILWALSQGVPVFGASSMGALRACELEQFGMVGVGRIFAAYRNGVFPPYTGEVFEDDDEVAVIHGPAESGYPSSEALVNIRCTLAKAADEGVITRELRDGLVSIAKGVFYKERSYANLFKQAAGKLGSSTNLDPLRAWLAEGRIDLKQEDALALLHHIREARPEAPNAHFGFERTTMWEHLLTAATDDPTDGMVLTELRLEGIPYLEARQRALSGTFHASLTGTRAHEAFDCHTSDTGPDPELTARRLQQHVRDETRRARTEILAEPLVDAIIVQHLRESGDYERLLSRAQAKRTWFESMDMFPPEIGDVDATPEDLTSWFCARSQQDPESDPTVWANRLQFEDTLSFLRALAGEYLYDRSQ